MTAQSRSAVAARRRWTRTAMTAAMAAMATMVIAAPEAAYAYRKVDDRSGRPAAAVPNGPITAGELGNATLDIPAWPEGSPPCPDGPLTFRDGVYGEAGSYPDLSLELERVIQLDVDGDGARETVAQVVCLGPEIGESVVLAFDRDQAGSIVRFGTVVAETGDIRGISGLQAAGSSVGVRVDDNSPEGLPDGFVRHQWRYYSWDGDRFFQSGGPTAFPPHPLLTDLGISGEVLRLSRKTNGEWGLAGTLSLTVHNAGPQVATSVQVNVVVQVDMTAHGPWTSCMNYSSYRDCTMTIGPLGVGESRTVEVPVTTVWMSEPGPQGDYRARVGWNDYPGIGNREDDSIVGRVEVV